MLKDGGVARDDMIESLISLALLKLRSANLLLRHCYFILWSVIIKFKGIYIR
jgi:hypothetical protein